MALRMYQNGIPVNQSGLTVASFDGLATARGRLTDAVAHALLTLTRLDAEKGRQDAARLYAILDTAIDAVRAIGREPTRCSCGELHHCGRGHVCR
jgi:hypothetical protein